MDVAYEGNMRPRKNKIALTKDAVIAVFESGERYTLAVLQHMFSGSPDELKQIVMEAEKNGELLSATLRRKERVQYWKNPDYGSQTAERRMMNRKEDLKNYDLLGHWRLAMLVRR